MVLSHAAARYVIVSEWTKESSSSGEESDKRQKIKWVRWGQENRQLFINLFMKHCLDVKHYKGAEYKGDDSSWERSSGGGGEEAERGRCGEHRLP